jgi:hypothetical protein
MGSISAQFIENGSPYLPIACVVVIAASVVLQVIYSKKVRACKARFQKSNDEVFHCLSDSLDGVKILRTAEETSWAISILSDAFKESRVCAVVNEKCTMWLMARVDAMAVVLAFLACVLSVALQLKPGSKGLVVSGSLQILIFYSWMMRNIAAAIYSSGSVDRIYEYINGIPQETRTGEALQKNWPKFGDIEVDDPSCIEIACNLSFSITCDCDNITFCNTLKVLQRRSQVCTGVSVGPQQCIISAAPCCQGWYSWSHRQRQEHAVGGSFPPYSTFERHRCCRQMQCIGTYFVCSLCIRVSLLVLMSAFYSLPIWMLFAIRLA